MSTAPNSALLVAIVDGNACEGGFIFLLYAKDCTLLTVSCLSWCCVFRVQGAEGTGDDTLIDPDVSELLGKLNC